jgi:hypothetical protein
MKSLAAVTLLVAVGCNTDGAAPEAKAPPDVDAAEAADESDAPPRHVAVSVGARDGAPHDRFSSKDEVFLTAFVTNEIGNPDSGRDHFFRVIDSSGLDVSRSDAACRRVRIGKTGQIETLYANGDEACPHSSAQDRTHGKGGVTVGLAPFGDANAILDGVATYEVQLAPVERFTGFQAPTYAASFVLDLRVARY